MLWSDSWRKSHSSAEKAKLVTTFWCRSVFDQNKLERCGHFLHGSLVQMIAERVGCIYPSGDRIHLSHSDFVNCAVVSLDGTHLYSASNDLSIVQWDLILHHKILQWKAHSEWIQCLAVGQSLLASGADDNQVRVWDVPKQQLIHICKGHSKRVTEVVIHDQSRSVISSSRDRTIRVWSLDSGECLSVLKGHSNYVVGLKIWDERRVVSMGYHSEIKVWSVEHALCERDISKDTSYVKSLCFNCDRSLIAITEQNESTVWNWPEMDTVVRVMEMTEYGCCFHPWMPNVAAIGDRTFHFVELYDVNDGRRIHLMRGHTGTIFGLCFTPDGSQLISVSLDTSVRVWDLSEHL